MKLRKTAEKLLLAHLKKHALDTVQAENALGSQKKKTPVKGKKKDALPQARVSCRRVIEGSQAWANALKLQGGADLCSMAGWLGVWSTTRP